MLVGRHATALRGARLGRTMAAREGIWGRHAVLQALLSDREVHAVLVDKESAEDPRLQPIRDAAARRGLPLRYASTAELVRTAGNAAQGIAAIVAPLEPQSVKGLVERARQRGEEPFLVAVDGIEDPQNLGAIARTALLAGCHGLIVPERGTAAIGAGAMKAAAGAFSSLPVAPVSGIASALSTLKREGVWIVGGDANSGTAPWSANFTGAVCFVLGSESEGLSRQALEALDQRVRIPTPGGELSLNVSAAASILLFERVRQTSAPRKERQEPGGR